MNLRPLAARADKLHAIRPLGPEWPGPNTLPSTSQLGGFRDLIYQPR